MYLKTQKRTVTTCVIGQSSEYFIFVFRYAKDKQYLVYERGLVQIYGKWLILNLCGGIESHKFESKLSRLSLSIIIFVILG